MQPISVATVAPSSTETISLSIIDQKDLFRNRLCDHIARENPEVADTCKHLLDDVMVGYEGEDRAYADNHNMRECEQYTAQVIHGPLIHELGKVTESLLNSFLEQTNDLSAEEVRFCKHNFAMAKADRTYQSLVRGRTPPFTIDDLTLQDRLTKEMDALKAYWYIAIRANYAALETIRRMGEEGKEFILEAVGALVEDREFAKGLGFARFMGFAGALSVDEVLKVEAFARLTEMEDVLFSGELFSYSEVAQEILNLPAEATESPRAIFPDSMQGRALHLLAMKVLADGSWDKIGEIVAPFDQSLRENFYRLLAHDIMIMNDASLLMNADGSLPSLLLSDESMNLALLQAITTRFAEVEGGRPLFYYSIEDQYLAAGRLLDDSLISQILLDAENELEGLFRKLENYLTLAQNCVDNMRDEAVKIPENQRLAEMRVRLSEFKARSVNDLKAHVLSWNQQLESEALINRPWYQEMYRAVSSTFRDWADTLSGVISTFIQKILCCFGRG